MAGLESLTPESRKAHQYAWADAEVKQFPIPAAKLPNGCKGVLGQVYPLHNVIAWYTNDRASACHYTKFQLWDLWNVTWVRTPNNSRVELAGRLSACPETGSQSYWLLGRSTMVDLFIGRHHGPVVEHRVSVQKSSKSSKWVQASQPPRLEKVLESPTLVSNYLTLFLKN